MNGYPLDLTNSEKVGEDDFHQLNFTVVTGNDLPMLNAKCLLIDEHKVCWDDEPVAKPFDFIDKRCKVIESQNGENNENNSSEAIV